MAVDTTKRKREFTGPISPSTGLSIDFRFLNEPLNRDLKAKKFLIADPDNETLLDYATDFTAAGGDPTGTVTMLTAITALEKVLFFREEDDLQQLAYPENDEFPAQSHKKGLDKLTMSIQELREGQLRTLRQSIQSPGTDDVVVPESEDGKFLGWALNKLVNLDGPVVPALTGSPVFRETVVFPATKQVFNIGFSAASKDDLTVFLNGLETEDFTLTSPTEVTMDIALGLIETERLKAVPRNIISQSVVLEALGVSGNGLGPQFRQPDGTPLVVSINDNGKLLVNGILDYDDTLLKAFYASVLVGEGASTIGLLDLAGNFPVKNVEAALAQVVAAAATTGSVPYSEVEITTTQIAKIFADGMRLSDSNVEVSVGGSDITITMASDIIAADVESSNTDYAIVVFNDTSLALSPIAKFVTSATYLGGLTPPAGYDVWALYGWARNNGSNDLIIGKWNDTVFSPYNVVSVETNLSDTNFVDKPMTGIVPPGTKSVSLHVFTDGTGTTEYHVAEAGRTGSSGGKEVHADKPSSTASKASSIVPDIALSATLIFAHRRVNRNIDEINLHSFYNPLRS